MFLCCCVLVGRRARGEKRGDACWSATRQGGPVSGCRRRRASLKECCVTQAPNTHANRRAISPGDTFTFTMRARLVRGSSKTTRAPTTSALLAAPSHHHTTATHQRQHSPMGMAASAPRSAATSTTPSGVCMATTPAAAAAVGSSLATASSLPLPPIAVVRDRAAGAIWAALAADALAMPVHWYYNPMDIQRHFPGGVGGKFPYGEDGEEKTGGESGASYFSAPKADSHPSSIMNLHSTGGQGRGSQSGSIIGDVINHGKKKYWGVPGVHYHNLLSAGDNTLNALCLRLTARAVSQEAAAASSSYGSDDRGLAPGHSARWLNDYVTFMTAKPAQHLDTYAESFHRAWFSNWARGISPAQCSKNTAGHDDSQIGGFFGLPPVSLAAAVGAARRAKAAAASPEAARQAAERAAAEASVLQVRLTHDSPKLEAVAARYGALLARVALAPASLTGSPSSGDDLLASASSAATALLKSEAAREANEGVRSAGIRALDVAELATFADTEGAGWDDVRVLHRVTGPACYIESSWPAVLYLSARHADPSAPSKGVKRGLESNANSGGENCHRGAALGALLGAAAGEARGVPKAMREGKGGLREGAAIRKEVDAFVEAAIGKEEL